MSKDFVLKENNEVVRKKIMLSGIEVCNCAWFVGSCWLHYNAELTDSVHGLGYPDEFGTTQEQILKRFETECPDAIYCTDVDEFIAKIKETQK